MDNIQTIHEYEDLKEILNLDNNKNNYKVEIINIGTNYRKEHTINFGTNYKKKHTKEKRNKYIYCKLIIIFFFDVLKNNKFKI